MKLRLEPTWHQHLAYQKLKDNTTEEIVFGGGAGGGKSHLGCEWEFRQCIKYPGVRYFIGRDELKKIRQSAVVTLHKVLRHHGVDPLSVFKFNGQDNCFKFHNGSQIDLLELKFIPSDPMYERFGSLEYTGGLIEEGGEVEEDAAIMIGSRTGRHLNDYYGITGKVLTTCNPKKNWLYYNFYLPWKNGTLSEDKAFIQALARHNKYGESGYLKKLQKLTGAIGQRLRDGNWEYENDPAALIETDAIGKVWEDVVWDFTSTLKHYITVDVARFGRDFSVIVVWQGWTGKVYKYHGLDTVQLAMKIREFMGLYNIPSSRVSCDDDGVGGGVVDQIRCVRFVNNSRPLPALQNPILDKQGNPVADNYQNLKAQCYYKTAEKTNLGTLKLMLEAWPHGTTQEHEKTLLMQEMEQVKRKKVDGDGKMDVLNREEMVKLLGRSPDYWSSIMQRYHFDLLHKNNTWI